MDTDLPVVVLSVTIIIREEYEVSCRKSLKKEKINNFLLFNQRKGKEDDSL